MKIIRLSIGFLVAVIAYVFYFISVTPKVDMFLMGANFVKTADPVEKTISKIYVKTIENKTCSTDGHYVSEKSRKDDARFAFVVAQAFLSVSNKNYDMADKKIIAKELDEASKYCKHIGGKVLESPPAVYIILSKDIDYFDIISRNCVSFDTEYDGQNSIRTPRQLLQNLMSCSVGKNNAIYTEMMNSLRRNEARCSGK